MSKSLIEKHKPYLILAEGEKYEPVYFEDYLKMTYLVCNGKKVNKSFEEMANDKKMNNGISCKLFIKNKYKETFKNFKSEEHPVHTYVKKKRNITQIVYSFFYTFNGPKDVLGFIPIGAHNADLEWVVIEFHRDKPKYVYLSQHGYNKKFKYSELEKKNNRIVVYSALNSHAHYPDPETYVRFYGFGNDNCSQGKIIDPKVVKYNNNSPAIKYKGDIGDKGVSTMGRFKKCVFE